MIALSGKGQSFHWGGLPRSLSSERTDASGDLLATGGASVEGRHTGEIWGS